MGTPRPTPSRVQFDAALAGGERPLVVGLPLSWIDRFVAAVRDRPTVSDCRLLLGDTTTSELSESFLTDARLSALMDEGRIRVRELSAPPDDRIVVGDGHATVFASVEGRVRTLETDDPDLLAVFRGKYLPRWKRADAYRPRAVSWSRLTATAESELSESFATDLASAIRHAEPVRWDDDVDPLATTLLVAARHELLLGDVASWASDIGMASRSSCSRTKHRLVDAGLIETERVPDGVGRPQQRLLRVGPATGVAPESLVGIAREAVSG
ncbi:MAG: DUF5821 family protein [Halolamina sp.]